MWNEMIIIVAILSVVAIVLMYIGLKWRGLTRKNLGVKLTFIKTAERANLVNAGYVRKRLVDEEIYPAEAS